MISALGYWHRSFTGQFVRTRKCPSARDMQNIGIPADIGWKWSESILSGQLHDAYGSLIQDLLARWPIDLDRFQAAIRLDANSELQIPVELVTSRCFRIIEVTDPLHLDAPILDITGKTVFLGT